MIRWPKSWVKAVSWFVENTAAGRKFEKFVWWVNKKLGGPSGPS